jgi:predicted heme/steroid binding protein
MGIRRITAPLFVLAIAFAVYRCVLIYLPQRRAYPAYENEGLPPITQEELALFSGENGPMLVSFYNVVYNVTGSPHYQKGGRHQGWAGHEITLAVAKGSDSFLDTYNEKPFNSVTSAEWAQTESYFRKFMRRYLKVARLIDPK